MESMDEIEAVVEAYGDMLYRICLVRLRRPADAEDAVQDVFLRYVRKAPVFSGEEHRKAWLIRVAVNRCRDILRRERLHPTEPIGEVPDIPDDESESGEVLRILSLLPEKYSTVMILHYVEGYTTAQIAVMIHRSGSAVKMRLQKGRELFRKLYLAEESK